MRVLLQTETGRIEIEIFDEQAPVTTGYFRGLVDRGDYDGATFYRSSTLDIADGPRLIQAGLLGGILSETIAKPARGVGQNSSKSSRIRRRQACDIERERSPWSETASIPASFSQRSSSASAIFHNSISGGDLNPTTRDSRPSVRSLWDWMSSKNR